MEIYSWQNLSSHILLDISWLPDNKAVWAIVGGIIVLLLTQYLRRNDAVKNRILEDAYQAIKLLDKELSEANMAITCRSIPNIYHNLNYRNISPEIKNIAEKETRLILGGRFTDHFPPLRFRNNIHLPDTVKEVLEKFSISKVEMTEDVYKHENDYLIFVGNTGGISGIGEGQAYKSVHSFISALEELQGAIDKWIAKYK